MRNMDITNPILPGFHPDPSIVRVGDDYFIATSSFEYFPGVPIHHSKDLKTWTHIGHALTRRSQLWMTGSEPGGGIWAPTLRYHEGMFYLAATCFSRFDPQRRLRAFPRGFYVKTENIWDSNSWTDPIYFDIAGFDQDIFWDTDGSVYLSTTHQKIDRPRDVDPARLDYAIHTCKVDLMTGNALSESKMIRESPIGLAEGSHLFRRGKYYYLVTAEGGTGPKHSVCIFRNTDGPFAEWESCPRNPILYGGTDGQIQNTGHADFFEGDDGRWWATLLAVRPDQNLKGSWEESVLGRETFLVSVEWSLDWPIMNGGREIACKLDTASKPSTSVWIDRFIKEELDLGWYSRNTPLKKEYQIMTDPNRLRLYGGPHSLDDLASPTMLLRKQTEKIGLWTTKLSYQPSLPSEEAGIVVWWNYLNYSTIGICTAGNERLISFKPAVGETVVRKLQSRDSHLYLYIECGNSYRFGFSEILGEVIWLGEVSNNIMTRSPAAGMAFTGMMVGLFAVAKDQRSMNPADFHYFSFKGGPTV